MTALELDVDAVPFKGAREVPPDASSTDEPHADVGMTGEINLGVVAATRTTHPMTGRRTTSGDQGSLLSGGGTS
jgi:hypothetical protein